MLPQREASEPGFFRLLLEVTDVGGDASPGGKGKHLSEACRQLGADLLYAVLPEEGGWTKTAYDRAGVVGTMPLCRPTGIVRHVLSKRARIVQARLSPRGTFNRHQDGWPGHETASFLAVPIHRQGRIRGVLVLLRQKDRDPFGQGDIGRAELLADALAVRADLEDRLLALERLSRTDGLTQLPNYRWARELLAREMLRSRRLAEPLAVIVLDIDGLREWNRRLGFLGGSEILVRVAQVIASSVRGSDHVGRLGGDEFLIILPDTTREGASCVAERICKRITQELLRGPGMPGVTCSRAVACFPEDGSDYAGLITAATQSLGPARRGSAQNPPAPAEERDRRAA